MKTLRLKIDPASFDNAEASAALDRAAEILRSGGLVALPTETVYGLGANALNAAAVAKIFAAKQRPAWDPIIVHIAGPVQSNEMLRELVTEVPEPARRLMNAFWPGPLTLLLPRSPRVPDFRNGGSAAGRHTHACPSCRVRADPASRSANRRAQRQRVQPH